MRWTLWKPHSFTEVTSELRLQQRVSFSCQWRKNILGLEGCTEYIVVRALTATPAESHGSKCGSWPAASPWPEAGGVHTLRPHGMSTELALHFNKPPLLPCGSYAYQGLGTLLQSSFALTSGLRRVHATTSPSHQDWLVTDGSFTKTSIH